VCTHPDSSRASGPGCTSRWRDVWSSSPRRAAIQVGPGRFRDQSNQDIAREPRSRLLRQQPGPELSHRERYAGKCYWPGVDQSELEHRAAAAGHEVVRFCAKGQPKARAPPARARLPQAGKERPPRRRATRELERGRSSRSSIESPGLSRSDRRKRLEMGLLTTRKRCVAPTSGQRPGQRLTDERAPQPARSVKTRIRTGFSEWS